MKVKKLFFLWMQVEKLCALLMDNLLEDQHSATTEKIEPFFRNVFSLPNRNFSAKDNEELSQFDNLGSVLEFAQYLLILHLLHYPDTDIAKFGFAAMHVSSELHLRKQITPVIFLNNSCNISLINIASIYKLNIPLVTIDKLKEKNSQFVHIDLSTVSINTPHNFNELIDHYAEMFKSMKGFLQQLRDLTANNLGESSASNLQA